MASNTPGWFAGLKVELPRSFPIALLGLGFLTMVFAASSFAIDTYRADLWRLGAHLVLLGIFAWITKIAANSNAGANIVAILIAYAMIALILVSLLVFLWPFLSLSWL